MNYAKIVPCDIANGPSVRVTLFVQGCNHHCPGCQNPTTWDPNGGQPFTDETLDKIVDLLRPDYIQGLTLTGGDPMLPENEPDIAHIIWKVRLLFGDKKDIWVWTGYILKELRRRAQNDDDEGMLSPTYEILSNIDVLVDGPFIQEKTRYLPSIYGQFKSASNRYEEKHTTQNSPLVDSRRERKIIWI